MVVPDCQRRISVSFLFALRFSYRISQGLSEVHRIRLSRRLCFFQNINLLGILGGASSWPLMCPRVLFHIVLPSPTSFAFWTFHGPGLQQPCSQPCLPLRPTYETRCPSSSNQAYFTRETRSGSGRVTLGFALLLPHAVRSAGVEGCE